MTKSQQTDITQLKRAIQSKFNDAEFWKSISSDTESALSTCQSLVRDDAHLDRLLVARNNDAEATLSLFWEQVEFRTKYKPEFISPIDLPVSLPSGAWRCCGFGKDGQVVSNYKLQCWNPEKYDNDVEKAMEEYTLYVCYFVELMIRCGKKNDRFSLIFDLKGFHFGMVTQEKVRLMIKRLIYVAQAQYPERLGKVYLVNAPFGFSTAWSLIQVLLDAKTASKIKFCRVSKLLQDIDETVLSTEYGGTHDEYPVPSEAIDTETTKIRAQ